VFLEYALYIFISQTDSA